MNANIFVWHNLYSTLSRIYSKRVELAGLGDAIFKHTYYSRLIHIGSFHYKTTTCRHLKHRVKYQGTNRYLFSLATPVCLLGNGKCRDIHMYRVQLHHSTIYHVYIDIVAEIVEFSSKIVFGSSRIPSCILINKFRIETGKQGGCGQNINSFNIAIRMASRIWIQLKFLAISPSMDHCPCSADYRFSSNELQLRDSVYQVF